MKIINLAKFLMSVILIGSIVYGSYFVLNHYVLGNEIQIIETSTELKGEGIIKESISDTNIDYFDEDVDFDIKKPFTILLMGVDGDSFKVTRTDTIMLGVVNPKTLEVSLLSIPRDLRVEYANNGRYDKLNAAIAYGGIDNTAATIENLFDISIDYYANINFKGFQDLVDTIGGVTVNVEKDMSFSDRITKTQFSLKEGEQKLSGIQALNYARFRGDGEGDYGRQRRQQQVIRALVSETLQLKNLTKISSIIDVVQENFQSNLSYTDLARLAIKLKNIDGNSIQTISLESYSDMIDGVSYVIASDESIENTKQILRDKLTSEK